MALKGDFEKLRRMVGELQAAGQGHLLRPITVAAKGQAEAQYEAEFTAQRDPWGGAWLPPKVGGGRALMKTGALFQAAFTAFNGAIKAKAPHYWVFHQLGANNMHQRGLFPFDVEASTWGPPMARVADRVVTRHFSTAD